VPNPFGIQQRRHQCPNAERVQSFTTADYTSNGGFSSTFPRFAQQSAAPPGTEFTYRCSLSFLGSRFAHT